MNQRATASPVTRVSYCVSVTRALEPRMRLVRFGVPDIVRAPEKVGVPVKVPARAAPVEMLGVPESTTAPENVGAPVYVPAKDPPLAYVALLMTGDVSVLLVSVCACVAPTRAPVTPCTEAVAASCVRKSVASTLLYTCRTTAPRLWLWALVPPKARTTVSVRPAAEETETSSSVPAP